MARGVGVKKETNFIIFVLRVIQYGYIEKGFHGGGGGGAGVRQFSAAAVRQGIEGRFK